MSAPAGEAGIDALIVVSFGGPEGPDDVMPFLERVTAGRDVPRPRLLQVAQQYEQFGGVSPINARTRELVAAVRARLEADGPALPVYWGNRNWHPLLADTVRQMADDGVRHAVAFVTSAYSGYSTCDQYVEDIARARADVGPKAPVIDKLPVFYDRRGFVDPLVEHTRTAIAALPAVLGDTARLVCTAHSVPLAMPGADDYVAQLRSVGAAVAAGVGRADWDLVFQSRSGPPTQPWLEPDIGDHLADLDRRGVKAVVVVPIGFVSDHMEVVYDLDVKAAEQAAGLGLRFTRVATPGTAPEFVAMIRDLLVELA